MAPDSNNLVGKWRAWFFSGLAIILPAAVSVALVAWLFGFVSHYTNKLLIFLPPNWTHHKGVGGEPGPVYWYWSWIALLLTILLICIVGRYGRNYFGRRAIEWIDQVLMQIPVLNKIYGTLKQVNESFHNNRSSFKQVVLVTFPHNNSRSMAFVTGEPREMGGEKLVSVFIPTTPNPTSGFLLLVPESQITKLDMSVADGIKFIISLGAITPESVPPELVPPVKYTATGAP